MRIDKNNLPQIIAIGLLLWALNDNPYGYYQILRWAVTGIAGYLAFIANENENTAWMWIMGIIAVLFNPIIPIYLDRETWTIIDVAVAGVFFVNIFQMKKNEKL